MQVLMTLTTLRHLPLKRASQSCQRGARRCWENPGRCNRLAGPTDYRGDDAVESRTSQLLTRDPAMTVFSRTALAIAALAVSFGIAVAPAALAEDTMSQGTMNKDTMGKGSMSKDTMSKGSMSKKSKKDTMEKDTMGKSGMSKDNMSH